MLAKPRSFCHFCFFQSRIPKRRQYYLISHSAARLRHFCFKPTSSDLFIILYFLEFLIFIYKYSLVFQTTQCQRFHNKSRNNKSIIYNIDLVVTQIQRCKIYIASVGFLSTWTYALKG